MILPHRVNHKSTERGIPLNDSAFKQNALGSQYLWLLRLRETARDTGNGADDTAMTGGVIDLSNERKARDG